MKIRVYKNITTFTQKGNEIEVTVKCKNRYIANEVSDSLANLQRDSGILCKEESEEVEIFKEKAQ